MDEARLKEIEQRAGALEELTIRWADVLGHDVDQVVSEDVLDLIAALRQAQERIRELEMLVAVDYAPDTDQTDQGQAYQERVAERLQTYAGDHDGNGDNVR